MKRLCAVEQQPICWELKSLSEHKKSYSLPLKHLLTSQQHPDGIWCVLGKILKALISLTEDANGIC